MNADSMMTGMVCIGFGQGIQPLLGYCVGAKLWERPRKPWPSTSAARASSRFRPYILQALLEAKGLAWAQPVADLLSTALVALLYLWTSRRMMAAEPGAHGF